MPRKVPLLLLESGVIPNVHQPTKWCSLMVETPKSKGKVRICVDLSKLNEYVKRENPPLPAVDTTLGRLAVPRNLALTLAFGR